MNSLEPPRGVEPKISICEGHATVGKVAQNFAPPYSWQEYLSADRRCVCYRVGGGPLSTGGYGGVGGADDHEGVLHSWHQRSETHLHVSGWVRHLHLERRRRLNPHRSV